MPEEKDDYIRFRGELGTYDLPKGVLDEITRDNYRLIELNISVLAPEVRADKKLVREHILRMAEDLQTKVEGEQPKEPEFITYDQTAKELGLTRKELERYFANGELIGLRRGGTLQFRRADVEKLKGEQK